MKKKKSTAPYVLLEETGMSNIIITDPKTGEDKRLKVAFFEEVKEKQNG